MTDNAPRAAKAVAKNLAYLEDMYAQDPQRATSEIEFIIAAEYEPVMDVLKDCQRAIRSLPQEALGIDQGDGYPYKNELLAKIKKVLG